jgi:hypothetical protein
MARGGGILANIDYGLVPESSFRMLLARDPPDYAVLASVEGDHDLERRALRTSKVVQNLANPTEARDVVETDDDGEVAR